MPLSSIVSGAPAIQDGRGATGYYDMNTRSWRPATAEEQTWQLAERQRRNSAARNLFLKTAIGSTAAMVTGGLAAGAMAGGGAAGAAAGGGAAAPAGAATGYASPGIMSGVSFGAPTSLATGGAATSGATSAIAPTVARVGTMGRIGSILNSSGMNLGVNAGLALYGSRVQQKAADQARADTLAAQRETLALERARLESEIANANLDREDARKAQEAVNDLRRQELAAANEEREFNRTIKEREIRLSDERESRQAPYREASAAALNRLRSIFSY